MLDHSTLEGKVITAAMDLAASPGWGKVSLRDIADAAGCSLADVMAVFETKQDIVAGFRDCVDRAMLVGAGDIEREQSARDALFEVIMSRFDLMAPYKAGLKSIVAEMRREVPVPGLGRIGATIRTQNQILQAAGIDHDGAALVLRQLGLAALYNQVFMIWLEDDDPGMARTMAALDRRLRQGERTLGFLDDMAESATRTVGQVQSFADRLGDILRGARTPSGAEGEAPPPGESPPAAPPENGPAAQT
jgi:ubiquinone biosynthesis protein COQ9